MVRFVVDITRSNWEITEKLVNPIIVDKYDLDNTEGKRCGKDAKIPSPATSPAEEKFCCCLTD